MSEQSIGGDEAPPCDLCDCLSVDRIPVENEQTGEMRDAELCEDCLDKLERYNAGEEVDWDV